MTTFNFVHVPTGTRGQLMARSRVTAVRIVRNGYGPGDVELSVVPS